VWDYPTNIDANPLFVTGPLGGYYLSQTDANSDNYPGQDTDSPCVDAGSDFAGSLGMTGYTTRTDEVSDRNIVDMGYHYPLRLELCSICDLEPDGAIDLLDFTEFSNHWGQVNCSDANNWCEGADFTFDGKVDEQDLAFCFAESSCYLAEDTEAPIPNPSEWKIEPHSTSTTPPYSISMTAETAFDAWWGWNVQYYFESVPQDASSGWKNEPNYTDIDLDPNTTYGYRVRARDRSVRIPDDGTGEPGNKTGWSVILYAPSSPPRAAEPPELTVIEASPNSITIQATTSDSNEIEYEWYNFWNITLDVYSGWQEDDPTWTNTGLDPNTTYSYSVQARDENGETTDWSVPLDATTLTEDAVVDITAPTPDPMLWAAGGEPEEIYGGGGGSDYYATMTAEVATDDLDDVEYNFICTTYAAFSSGWQDSPTYTKHVGMAGQAHMFYVIAHDLSPSQNETGPSPIVAAIPRP